MMMTVHWVNALLLVMGIFGNLGVALKTGATADQDSDGDDSSDENTVSQEETSAPDNDGSSNGGSSSSSIGSAGGALDVSGLQNSLKEGGVDGLNNMLKSLATTMNSAGSVNGANMHITTDADGHEMYDFRDLEASSPHTRAHAESAQAPPLQALPLQPKATKHTEKKNAETLSSDMAVSSIDEKSNDVSSGNLVVPNLGKTVALPLHATTKGMPLPSVWESRKQTATAKVVLERPIPPPKFETTDVTVRAVAPPVAEQEVSRPEKRLLPPSSTATGGSIAKLSSSLDEVRHSVDTLLTLALRKQDEAPLAYQKEPVMELPLQNQQMSERVGALERENSKLERMLQVQAGRLEAIESQQQDEDHELGQVLHENSRLRALLHKTKSLKVRSRALLRRGSKRIAKKRADHHIRTYYHLHNNSSGQKH